MVPGPSVRTIVRTDGISSRFHQRKISHISDNDLHAYKIVNLTLLRQPLCTSSSRSQLLAQVACRKKATRPTFSPTRFGVTWIHLSRPSFQHITTSLNSSQPSPTLSPHTPSSSATALLFPHFPLSPHPLCLTWPFCGSLSVAPGSPGRTRCPTARPTCRSPLARWGLLSHRSGRAVTARAAAAAAGHKAPTLNGATCCSVRKYPTLDCTEQIPLPTQIITALNTWLKEFYQKDYLLHWNHLQKDS